MKRPVHETVAILGAGGFIGNRALEILHMSGRYVVRPVTRTAASLALASRYAVDGRVGEALDKASLELAFEGCQHVIHAIAGPPDVIEKSVEPVYRAAAAVGVKRMVYLSSASVHGQAPPPGTNENSLLSDRQAIEYNNAKVRAERTLLRLRAEGSVEMVILRPGIVYGPRSGWITSFADNLISRNASILNEGVGVCNAVYVDNVIAAIDCALKSDAADGQSFLLVDREKVRWGDLLDPIAKALELSYTSYPAQMPGRRLFSPRLPSRRQLATLIIPRLPKPLRAAVLAGLAEIRSPSRCDNGDDPRSSLETLLLQTNTTQLSSVKAERQLGYRQPTKFADAMKRTVEWLRFADYPVRGEQ